MIVLVNIGDSLVPTIFHMVHPYIIKLGEKKTT